MSLDLSPDTEAIVREYARQEGVSIDTLIRRTFASHPSHPSIKALKLADAIRQWHAEDATEDEDELDQRDRESAQLHSNLDDAREQRGMRLLFQDQP